MREIKFLVDESRRDILQKLAVETESRQSLIAFMLNQDMVNHSNFTKYQDEYKDFYLQYSRAKIAFQKDIVDPILQKEDIDPSLASWALDFDACEVTITIQDQNDG